jgi:hypothetical protein
MKKLIAVVFASALLLTGCSSTNGADGTSEPTVSVNENYGKLLNKKVHTEEWDSVKVDIYYIAIDKIGKEYSFAYPDAKPTDEVIAVRYDFTNVSDKAIDIYGINIANAGFDKPEKPLGSVNYSNISLHVKLGYETFPEAWDGTTKWVLQPNETMSVSFDWLVENKDYIMTYSWLFPFEKDYRIFQVTFK